MVSKPTGRPRGRPTIVDDVELAILEALFRQRKQEVRQSPPDIIDVAEMIAAISTAATREREKVSKGETPDESEAVQLCLWAVLQFLMKQPRLMERGDFQPLLRLHGALCDLKAGKVPDLFKPEKKAGRPPVGVSREFYQSKGARILSELIEAGEDKHQSAKRIAAELNKLDIGNVEAATVINWRERLEQGEGQGASKDAVLEYLEPVPGDTPKERGENLLKAFGQRARLTV
jgi:hypothetical protein